MVQRIRKQVVHVIGGVDRVGSGPHGRATHRLYFEDGTSALTETDGGIGYQADEFRPRLGHPVRPVIVTFTGAGRVAHLEFAPPEYIERLGEVITPGDTIMPKSRVHRGALTHA